MSSPGPKQAVFTCLAEIAQALGHAHRLELLEHLGQGERSVEDLAACAPLTFANTSRHLQILRRARLVEPRREGKRMLLQLAGDDEVVRLLHALGRVGERNMRRDRAGHGRLLSCPRRAGAGVARGLDRRGCGMGR